jgi:large conductance mechanosensitive channel
MWQEFRDFLKRGNVIDLAVAVIIGAAFAGIIRSLVDDIVMPLIGVLLGGINFSELTVQVGDAVIAYGNFIQAIINFVLIAFVLFMFVRYYNKLQHQPDTTPPPPPAEDIVLLGEIRDLLKNPESDPITKASFKH